jgi:hypothetical protein
VEWLTAPATRATASYALGAVLLVVYFFRPDLRDPFLLGAILALLGLPQAFKADRSAHEQRPDVDGPRPPQDGDGARGGGADRSRPRPRDGGRGGGDDHYGRGFDGSMAACVI